MSHVALDNWSVERKGSSSRVSFTQLSSVLELEVTVKAETLLCNAFYDGSIAAYTNVHGAVIVE